MIAVGALGLCGDVRADGLRAPILLVQVVDAQDRSIPGAQVVCRDGGTRRSRTTDANGRADFRDLKARNPTIEVSAGGFRPHRTTVSLQPGQELVYRVRLEVAPFEEYVVVTPPPILGATPRILTPREIAQLPDDPEGMARALERMAGPGAVIRVDGFRGGTLPPKSEIREISFHLDPYSAESHEIGYVFVEILTRPPTGRWRGQAATTLRNHALDARPAFLDDDPGGSMWSLSGSAAGAVVPGRTGLALSVSGQDERQSVAFAGSLPSGTATEPAVRRSRALQVSLRGQQVLTATHTLRLELQRQQDSADPLGVGGLDLPERGYRQRASSTLLRLGESGAFGSRAVGKLRVQLGATTLENLPRSPLPTTDVLGAFRAGGASTSGERRERQLDAAADFDLPRGPVTLQFGGGFGRAVVSSDLSTGRNGTYTYASVEALRQERPLLFARRVGDPDVHVTRNEWNAYIQAARASRTGRLSVNGGLRLEGQTGLPRSLVFVSPRAFVAWSLPFDRALTLKLGGGIFRPWMDVSALDQVRRLDGRGEVDLLVTCAASPRACFDVAPAQATPSTVRLDPQLTLPTGKRGSLSLERHLANGAVHLVGSVAATSWTGLLRSRNDNPAGPRGRPDPAHGNLLTIVSQGEGSDHELHLHATYSPSKRFVIGGEYWWSRKESDTDGMLFVPQNDPAAERGPTVDDIRNRALFISSVSLPGGFSVDVTGAASGGAPYDITSGRDDNGDGVFTDRPAGVGRNRGRGRSIATVDLRVGWQLRRETASPGGVTVTTGSGEGLQKASVACFVSVSNALNTFNPQQYVGVVTSPSYALPVAASAQRRISLRISTSF